MQISQSSKVEFVRLGDYVDVKGRIGWKGLKKQEYTTDGPFMISGYNLYNRRIDWDNCLHISQFRYNESPEIKLESNDIIMTKDGTIGRLGYIENLPGPATINSTIVLIREISNVFFPEFLYYYFQGPIFQQIVKEKVSGLSVPHIFQRDIKELKVPKLPKNEQQKIALILSILDELIQKTDQIIEQTQRLKKGLMRKLLTKGIGHSEFKEVRFYNETISIPKDWAVGKLRDYTTKIGSGITPRGGSKVYQSKGIPLIRSQNVHFDGLQLEDVAYITRHIHNEMKNTKLKGGEVLLNITGASLGRCTVVPSDFGEGNVNQHVCIIRPNYTINSVFLSLFLSSNLGQKMIFRSPNGLSREGLNFKEIGSFNLLIPPIEEQQRVAAIISSITSKIQKEILYKSLIMNLKTGLMQKLLTDKIRVKV